METSPQGVTVAPNKNVAMGVLAYLGPLVIVSYLVAKDDPFVKFHIKQGLVLLVLDVAVWFIGSFTWRLWFILGWVNFAIAILVIIGIVKVVQGKQEPLPLVGQFASYFNAI
jgi:uncharacterized membrane protein